MSKSRNCTCPQCGGRRIPYVKFLLADGTRVELCVECRDGIRTCVKCGETGPLSSFYPHQRKDQYKLSYSAKCKKCICAEKRVEQPARRLKRYGMTSESYDAMIVAQGGRCAACGVTQDRNTWHIDHDHACCPGERTCGGCVRGLLCRDCNLTLGHAREDVGRLLGLVDYISGFRGNGDLPVNQFDIRRAVPTGT